MDAEYIRIAQYLWLLAAQARTPAAQESLSYAAGAVVRRVYLQDDVDVALPEDLFGQRLATFRPSTEVLTSARSRQLMRNLAADLLSPCVCGSVGEPGAICCRRCWGYCQGE